MSVTIITPAAGKNLTTVENVRLDLGAAVASLDEAQVLRLIGQASARASSYCRRTFGRETVRETFGCSLHGRPELRLDRDPAFAVDSVFAGGSALTIDAYEFDGASVLRCDTELWAGRHGSPVVVQYQAGWLLPGEVRGESIAPELPLDIEQAVILLISASLNAAGRDVMVRREEFVGIGQTDYFIQGANAALPHPEAEAILRGYRRMVCV